MKSGHFIVFKRINKHGCGFMCLSGGIHIHTFHYEDVGGQMVMKMKMKMTVQ